MIDIATRERASYLARVASRLQGLEPEEREELLENLREHLAEIEVEAAAGLEDRLGPPERYADELLAAAGLDANVRARAKLRSRVRGAVARDLARLQPLLDHPDVAASLAGLRQARPAWWVVRGWLVVVVLDALFWTDRSGLAQPVPSLGGTRSFGVVAIVAAAAGSVWLGRRTSSRRAHRVSVAGNVLLVLLCIPVLTAQATPSIHLAGWDAVDPQALDGARHVPGALVGPDGRTITNLHPYGPDGEPLERIRLYDQHGEPVEIVLDQRVDGVVTSFDVDADGRPVPHSYPQRQVSRWPADDGVVGSDGPAARVPALDQEPAAGPLRP